MRHYQVRLLRTHEEFRACEKVQTVTWGTLSVAGEVLMVTQHHGGVVVGAITGGKVVGFLYAFPAVRHGQLIHWSHMMGVMEGYRDLGLGLRMKQLHRRVALERGIQSVCWTYDPLQSRNGALNVARLGAEPEEYLPNYYGQLESHFEKDLPSDRMVVNWRLGSKRVEQRLERPLHRPRALGVPRINETHFNKAGLLENLRLHLDLRGPRLAVEIPSNTETIRSRDVPLARRWRFETRKIFQKYYRAGYRITDFFRLYGIGKPCFYILERRPA
jgi:predicted GNAT superfamily acetyltransferase